jgi:hypothetical protein
VTAADADTIVDLALEGEVPVILDISGFLREEDADEVVHRVVKRLFQREKQVRKPFLLIAEEVHEYMPQQGSLSDAGETLIQVAKRGRKHGLGFIGVSQRPASVDKDFITQCDWITWHRLTWKNDTEVVRTLLGSDAADEVEELDPGEAILMTDWDESVEHVTFRKKRTFDAGATPGFDDFDPPELLPVGGNVLERFGVEGEDLAGEAGRARNAETAAADQAADDEAAAEEGETGETEETPVAETQVVEDRSDDGEEPADGEATYAEGGAEAAVVDGEETVEPLETPDDGRDPPQVVDAEPIETDDAGGAARAGGKGGPSSPHRATPASARAQRRRRKAQAGDQPAVVEFGQMLIYLSKRVGGAVGRGVGALLGAIGGRAGAWWREGNVSDDDIVVIGWLLLVVLFIAAVTVAVAVAI